MALIPYFLVIEMAREPERLRTGDPEQTRESMLGTEGNVVPMPLSLASGKVKGVEGTARGFSHHKE